MFYFLFTKLHIFMRLWIFTFFPIFIVISCAFWNRSTCDIELCMYLTLFLLEPCHSLLIKVCASWIWTCLYVKFDYSNQFYWRNYSLVKQYSPSFEDHPGCDEKSLKRESNVCRAVWFLKDWGDFNLCLIWHFDFHIP